LREGREQAEQDIQAIHSRMEAYSLEILKVLKERREPVVHEAIIKELVNAKDRYTLAKMVLDYELPLSTRVKAIKGLKEIGATYLRDSLKKEVERRIVVEQMMREEEIPPRLSAPSIVMPTTGINVSIEKFVLSKIDEILTPG